LQKYSAAPGIVSRTLIAKPAFDIGFTCLHLLF